MQQSIVLSQRSCICSSAFGSSSSRRPQQTAACASARSGDNPCCSSSSSSICSSTALQLPGKLALAAAAVATSLQLCLPALAVVPGVAAGPSRSMQQTSSSSSSSSWQPVLGDMSLTATAAAPAMEQDEDEMEEITAQVALPPELMSFMEMTEKGQFKDLKRLQEARRSVGFERSPDGRVFLLTEDGEPFQVKNDMGVPGLLLLRDAGGYCYFLPPPEDNTLVQIDLSDDAIVAQLFANHAWEELVEPLEVVSDTPASDSAIGAAGESHARLQQLRLTERQFRTVVSLAAGAQELPEEPLEDLDAQEQ